MNLKTLGCWVDVGQRLACWAAWSKAVSQLRQVLRWHVSQLSSTFMSTRRESKTKLKCVACGVQLYMWAYGKDPENGGAPVSVLKTRRSLRCVQFSPCGAPYILTAEASQSRPLYALGCMTEMVCCAHCSSWCSMLEDKRPGL